MGARRVGGWSRAGLGRPRRAFIADYSLRRFRFGERRHGHVALARDGHARDDARGEEGRVPLGQRRRVRAERSDGESVGDDKETPFVISLVGGLFNGSTKRYAEEVKRRTTALLRRRFEGDRSRDERYVFYEDRASRTCGDVGGPMAGAVAMAAEAFEAFEESRRRNPDAPVSAVSRARSDVSSVGNGT